MSPEPAAATGFVLGHLTSEYLRVRVLIRTRDADDAWDGNWLTCAIDARAGAFTARMTAHLRAEDFARFRAEADQLYRTLSGRAEFSTMEGWLRVELVGTPLGHLTARCELIDDSGTGNRLAFGLELDQTYLPPLVASLDAIIAAFPARPTT